MSKYLITTSETYRVDSEPQAKQLIEEAQKSSQFDLVKYNCEYKTQKAKGEIVDAWYRVTLVKSFEEEKEPIYDTKIIYERDED